MLNFISNFTDKFKGGDFHIEAHKKVKTIQSDFKQNFGLTLRVYKGKQLADPKLTLAELNSKTSKNINYSAEDVTIKASMTIHEVEQLIDSHFGLTVQIAKEFDNYCINNKYTLGQALRQDDLKDWCKGKGFNSIEEWLKSENCSSVEEFYSKKK